MNPDEMKDFGVTHKNKGLLLSQRAEELFPTKEQQLRCSQQVLGLF